MNAVAVNTTLPENYGQNILLQLYCTNQIAPEKHIQCLTTCTTLPFKKFHGKPKRNKPVTQQMIQWLWEKMTIKKTQEDSLLYALVDWLTNSKSTGYCGNDWCQLENPINMSGSKAITKYSQIVKHTKNQIFKKCLKDWTFLNINNKPVKDIIGTSIVDLGSCDN